MFPEECLVGDALMEIRDDHSHERRLMTFFSLAAIALLVFAWSYIN